jgi:hypothetical protein
VITYSGGGERKEGMDRSWKQIESLLAHHTPAEILCSLEEVTRQATDRLHSHTLSVDLGRDAQQLQYCYDGWGGMRDSSEQPSLLHAVEQQLLEAQLSHIRRSVESECARRGAREARATAAHLQNQLLQTLEERYGDGQEGDALELAKLLYTRLDLEVAGSEAALRKLGSICSTLDQARLQRRTIVEELRAKLRKIQEFAQVAVSSGHFTNRLHLSVPKKNTLLLLLIPLGIALPIWNIFCKSPTILSAVRHQGGSTTRCSVASGTGAGLEDLAREEEDNW